MIEGVFIDGPNLEDAHIVYDKTYNSEFKINSEFYSIDFDINNIYIVVYEDKVPIGSGRLNINDYIIDHVSVVNNYRNKGYGDLIVRMLIDKAFRFGVDEVYAYVHRNEFNFFEKVGFVSTDQDVKINEYNFSIMKINEKLLVKNCCNNKKASK